MRYNRFHDSFYWNEDSYFCKPFKDLHKEQLKLVSSFDWIDFSKLDGLDDEIRATFSAEQAQPYIEPKRCEAIIEMIHQGIEEVRSMMQNRDNESDITDNDVASDVAASY